MEIRNIHTLVKREIKSYFYTPLAYAFIGVFALLMGFMFYSFLATYMMYTAQSQFGMAPTVTIDRLSEAFYANMHVILMFVLPFFTMRSFTEESRQNTMTLLLTSPVSVLEITMAKFLAGVTMLGIMILITAIFPAFLFFYAASGGGGPDVGVVFSTYLGLLLAGCAYLAFGIFWSSVTESQLVAVVLSFATNFGFWLVSIGAQAQSGFMQKLLSHLAINEQFMTFAKGSLELAAFVYFISLISLGLFLTHRSIESRAWRS